MISDPETDPLFNTVQRMITERGAVWASVGNGKDIFSAVVVTDNPCRCLRLILPDQSKPSEWQIHYDTLNAEELSEFFAAFGSHWRILLKSKFDFSDGRQVPVRAFIKNGRKRGGGWSISLDAQPLAEQKAA